MKVTATKVRRNIDKYLSLANGEDIYITRYNKVVAILRKPSINKLKVLSSLIGFAKGPSISLDDMR